MLHFHKRVSTKIESGNPLVVGPAETSAQGRFLGEVVMIEDWEMPTRKVFTGEGWSAHVAYPGLKLLTQYRRNQFFQPSLGSMLVV